MQGFYDANETNMRVELALIEQAHVGTTFRANSHIDQMATCHRSFLTMYAEVLSCQ